MQSFRQPDGAHEAPESDKKCDGTSARPPPESIFADSFGNALAPLEIPAIPTDIMQLIRQVARYHGKIHEGLHLNNGDLQKAIGFACKSSDGMTETVHETALTTIGRDPVWATLLHDLIDAACRAVDEQFD